MSETAPARLRPSTLCAGSLLLGPHARVPTGPEHRSPMVRGHEGRAAHALRTGCLAGVLVAGVLTAGAPAAGPATRPLHAVSSTVWLCNPDQAADPCTTSRAATAVTGEGRPAPPSPRPRPPRADSTASTSTRRSRPSRASTPTSRCKPPSGRPPSSRHPASPSAAPCGPPCTARSRWPVWRGRRRQRGPSRTAACSPPGRTTWPTTTTAGRSSSSGTRRARPC